jgi:hypothetical protein
MKTQILAAIGETILQPAAQLNEALAANDRIKYLFSLLQVALSNAEHPEGLAATLKKERLACGIDDPDFDTIIAGSRMSGRLCRMPGAARILSRIVADLRMMAAPVLADKPRDLNERLDRLLVAVPAAKDDLLDADAVDPPRKTEPQEDGNFGLRGSIRAGFTGRFAVNVTQLTASIKRLEG